MSLRNRKSRYFTYLLTYSNLVCFLWYNHQLYQSYKLKLLHNLQGHHCSKIMKPPQRLPLQMAERLLRTQPDSVANHNTVRSISVLTWLATETAWARSKRSAICIGKFISVYNDLIRREQAARHLEYICIGLWHNWIFASCMFLTDQLTLYAKHRHNVKTIGLTTVRQEQRGSRICSYIRHKRTQQHVNTKLITRNDKYKNRCNEFSSDKTIIKGYNWVLEVLWYQYC